MYTLYTIHIGMYIMYHGFLQKSSYLILRRANLRNKTLNFSLSFHQKQIKVGPCAKLNTASN